MAGSVRNDGLIKTSVWSLRLRSAPLRHEFSRRRTYSSSLYHTKQYDGHHWSHMGLHVFDTPFMTMCSNASAFILLLKVFFLEPVTAICDMDPALRGRGQKKWNQRTHTVPPITRFDSKPVWRWRRTCIFGFLRTFCSLFLLVSRGIIIKP